MRSAPTPIYEQQRLDALRRYGVLDSLPEQVYDDVVKLAAQICGMPIAMISLVDTDRQWFKAKLGVDQPGTPRDIAFCAHAILERDVFVVPNAAVDERFHDNPLVTGSPGIQFYAGAPIVTPDGFAIGAVCVNDRMPRQLNEGQLQALQSLARQVVGHLELRRELATREGLLRELVTARERHDLVVRASREGIWDCDYVTDVTIVSPRGCEIFDLEDGPFRSSLFDWLSRVHPDDLEATRAAFDAHIRTKSAYDIEFRWRLRDGSYRWVHVRGLAVHDERGQLVRLAGSVSDIEDKKRDELALRRLSHLLEESQRLAAVGGWELDLATNELFWTDETYRLHETSPSEYRPTVESAIAFYEQDSLPTIARLVVDAKTTGTPYAVELQLRTKKGRHIWVQTTGKCVFENGRPVRLVGTFQDITDRRRAADELRCAVEAAEAANRSKSEFLATMSHEIRTPMNAVLGYASLLLDTELDAQQRDYLGVVERSGQALLRLIDDVLDYAKIEAGRMDIEHLPFSVRTAVLDVVRMLEPRARQKGLHFAATVDDRVPAKVVGDSHRFGQVLLNLASNAIKFTERGSIELSVRCENGHLRLDVRDTGIGIDKDQQRRLFREFTQADTSTWRRFGGTGLGLAISRRLVELMGGTIGVESVLGAGSNFWLEVPIVLPTATAGPTDLAGETQGSVRPLAAHVLVVEDNPVNQHLATRFLQSLGCTVAIANNGVEAVHEVENGAFDLVLMDCMMPEMDGYEATRAIRRLESANGRHTPIVALTANAMPDDRKSCLAAGMDDYLAKPFRRSDLKRVLHSWLGHVAD